MLEFKRVQYDADAQYAVTEGERTVAVMKVNENVINAVEFASHEDEMRYGEFTVRSLVFALRDRFSEIKCAFVDERLRRLGFIEENGGMRVSSIKITFDNCGGCTL